MLAPIVVFVYHRPWHTRQTLESLMKNELADQSRLFIYADGSKNNSELEVSRVNEVRKIIREKQWCKEVTIIESEQNRGLADSVIKGVTEIINEYGKIIVLEDDMLSSKYFLKFMNDALEMYENEENVACVSGYAYPIEANQTYFIKGAEIWGWGTWKISWNMFEPDGEKLYKELRSGNLTYRFDLNGSMINTSILEAQIRGQNSSWGIRWYASAFLNNKLNLYPPKSLIKNIGFDGSGTHCGVSKNIEEISFKPVEIKRIKIQENSEYLQRLIRYQRNKRLIEKINRIKIKLQKIIVSLYIFINKGN